MRSSVIKAILLTASVVLLPMTGYAISEEYLSLPKAANKIKYAPGEETADAIISRLLGISQDALNPSSSCYDEAKGGKQTIGDFLSMELGGFSRGKNHLDALCKDNVCRISLWHAYGEDVYSADIFFKVKDGKAQVSSLECDMTP